MPRDATHGDWTTNIAMLLAKELRRPPRAIAESLVDAFPWSRGVPFQKPEVAGAGFVNFRYDGCVSCRELPAAHSAKRGDGVR